MAKGGFHDQVGGGFHRYSVDEAWIVPHFEKMADDNAWLLRNYVSAWSVFGDAYTAVWLSPPMMTACVAGPLVV
jgi:uncharacterized protein YyaL (SSP411 family)